MLPGKLYLGDSVYADYDGYYLTLTTENGLGGPSNRIMLEPQVIEAFNRYCKAVADAIVADLAEG